MSDLKCFSIHDQKLEMYIQPFFAPTAAHAIRSFTDAVNQEGTDFNRHAEDYTLWYCGDFDQERCQLQGLQAPVCLAKAFDVLEKNTPLLKEA